MLLQTQSPQLRHLTSAHLAQTMSLLELTSVGLRQKIETELAGNPALEIIEEKRCPTCHRLLSSPRTCVLCSRLEQQEDSRPIVFISPSSDFLSPTSNNLADHIPQEELTAAIEDLPSYVLRQIAPELNIEDRSLAAHILTSLDDDGLLTVPLLEIARYHHVTLSHLEKVLRLIQHADPLGVGSLSPQQALIIQLEVLSETYPVPPLARRVVQEGMELLSRRAYADLSQILGTTITEIQRIAQFISANLNPYPARSHWGEFQKSSRSPDTYYEPDIIISRLYPTTDTPLVVEIVSPYAGALRVNPLFRASLAMAPADKLSEWQSDLEQANLLVKCLQQRDHSLVRLMELLVVIQRQFILLGDASLQPVTRAALADELDVHESTISRAVANKAVQLPNKRIIPLARFFDRSLHIRAALRLIVAKENRPLSDMEIADMLERQGFEVARRTVAKYRAIEGILPARYRQITPPVPGYA